MRTFAQCSGDFVTLMMKTREETKAELTGCAGTDWKPPASTEMNPDEDLSVNLSTREQLRHY